MLDKLWQAARTRRDNPLYLRECRRQWKREGRTLLAVPAIYLLAVLVVVWHDAWDAIGFVSGFGWGIATVIAPLLGVRLAAETVARDRQQGRHEDILLTALTAEEILVAKLLPVLWLVSTCLLAPALAATVIGWVVTAAARTPDVAMLTPGHAVATLAVVASTLLLWTAGGSAAALETRSGLVAAMEAAFILVLFEIALPVVCYWVWSGTGADTWTTYVASAVPMRFGFAFVILHQFIRRVRVGA